MINAFKRLVAPNSNEIKDKENASNGSHNTPGSISKNGSNNIIATLPASFLNNGMQMISQSLQKKFSKGVNYNMKIVIRGDCNVGKTTLWLRLQGQPFKEVYETSEEIKVANIQWSFKSTDDIVKVEVWDVVDRSKKKRNLLNQPRNASNSISLKLDNETINGSKQAVEQASLDAEFIDVYKNANGVILVYDITKQWTWDYIEREVPKIPTHIPLLIIGNHRDMNHHRCIDELKCKYYIENLSRGSLGSAIRYTETSMRTGFGLKYIHKFFNIPFLQLQRETLMQHLETNAKEMDAICEELQEIEENIDNDYDEFSMSLNTTRRQQQEENAKDILKNAKTIEEARKLAAEKEAAAALSAQIEAQQDPKKAINQFINKINTKVTQIAQVSSPTPISMSVTVDTNDKKNKSLTNLTNSISHNSLLNKNQTKNTNPINELPHDDELDRFLDDPFKTNKTLPNTIPPETKAINKNDDDDDDDEDQIGNNPMVTIVKDTIDSSDESELKFKTNKLASTKAPNVQQIDLSDEEESEKIQFKSTTKKQVKNKTPSNGDFVFVNNKSTNNSTYSNSSNDTSNIILQNSDIRQNPAQAVLDTFSATSSIVNLDIGNNVSKSENASNTDQTQQIQLTNDDFDFLEKMTTVDKEAKISSSSKTKKASSDKKIKSSKSSSKISEDSQSFNDESSQNSSNKKTKKNKDSSEVKEKKEKKKSKSSSKKSSRKQHEDEEDDGEDDNKNHVSVKKDEDYEEL